MKEISAILGYRDSIRVVDATLRDGGLCNDFYFTDDFVRDLYAANVDAGVDYMEVGYKASKKLFDKGKFGKWKFTDDDDILSVIGENSEKKVRLAAMADVGRTDFREDIRPRSDSPLDLIRVACYVHQIPGAIEMIEDAKKKGYEVSCNIMAISTAQEGDIRVALDMIGASPVDAIFIVDSFGSIYPEQMQRIAAMYKECADKYGKSLGIHAHNNQQLAFANTIEDNLDINCTTADIAERYKQSPSNVRNVLSRNFMPKPKRRVYYSFSKFIKYIPKRWVRHTDAPTNSISNDDN